MDILSKIEEKRTPKPKIEVTPVEAPPVKADLTPQPKVFTDPKLALAQKRRSLAEAEQNLTKYQGLAGVFRTLTDSGKGQKQKFEDAAEKAKSEYQTSRAEIVGENALQYVEELQHLTDAKARAFESQKGIGTKLYEFYKKLGEKNLLKSDWYIKTKFGQTKLGQMFGRAVSARTAVNMGLLGFGTAFGAGSAAGVAAFAGRRLLSGASASVGSYDLMRMAADRRASKFDEDALAEMSQDVIVERMEKISASAMLDGKSLGGNAAFQSLKGEFAKRMQKDGGPLEVDLESTLVTMNVQEMMSMTDARLEELRAKGQRNRRVMKGLAAVIGMAAGSGVLGRGIGKGVLKAKHAVFGDHHETVKAVAKSAKPVIIAEAKPVLPTHAPEELHRAVAAHHDSVVSKPPAPSQEPEVDMDRVRKATKAAVKNLPEAPADQAAKVRVWQAENQAFETGPATTPEPGIQVYAGFRPGHDLNLGEGFRAHFVYDDNGKTSGLVGSGDANDERLGDALLKENWDKPLKAGWQEGLEKMGFKASSATKPFDYVTGKNFGLHDHLANLQEHKLVLKVLEQAGKEQSPEADYCRKIIAQTSKDITDRFGNILKDVGHDSTKSIGTAVHENTVNVASSGHAGAASEHLTPSTPEAVPSISIPDGKAVIEYATDGKVHNISFAVTPKFQERMFWSHLKDHWMDSVKATGHYDMLKAHTDILGRLRTVVLHEELLQEFEKSGHGSGKEAIYLKNVISIFKQSIRQSYGDIVK